MTIGQIVSGGQTGVDQGAAFAALACGVALAGYRPALDKEQSESGPIPKLIRERLTPVEWGGYQARTLANVVVCDLCLLVVENRQRPRATPGTDMTIRSLGINKRQYLVVDPETKPEFVVTWLAHMSPLFSAPVRLMVAGPRESKWPNGKQVAYNLVKYLLEPPPKVKKEPNVIHYPIRDQSK